jgi:hypothetical protein
MEELIAEEYRHIKEALSFNVPSVRVDEVAQPLGYGATNPNFNEVDFDVLVDMRRQHQTHHAATGVRTKGAGEKPLLDAQKDISLRRQIIRRFHEVLKEEQDHAPCTGSDRKIHWRAPAPGARDGQVDGETAPTLESGNSANAALSAQAVAKKVCWSEILCGK